MPGVTKVGPPERSDRHRKPNMFERIWRIVRWWGFPFNTRAAARIAEAEMALEEPEREEAWRGLPEADLTEEQREAAVRRIKDEAAIRRARGK